MHGGEKALLPVIFTALVILSSGCINLDPESFARTMPMAQEFLDEHPNAELRIVHYTATEAESILDQIKEDCGKTTIEAKEYYFVNITDPETDLVMRAWIDWENRIVECVYKEGSLNRPIAECTPRYEAECFGDHLYWFDSCGNREDKKEFCPMGCSGGSCILSSEHCDINEVYTEKPPCTCPPGYEMILIYPKCTENECMENCENECRENVIMPCIDICVARYECGEDENCIAEVNGKCRTICHEKDDLSECMRECSIECRGVEDTESGITGAMIMETLGTPRPMLSSEEFGTFRPSEAPEQAQAIVISPSYTPLYKERCIGTDPVYKCVKREYCTSNAQFRCYSGHVYWFDSCGHVQDKKDYCEYGCYDGVCKTAEGSNCYEMGGHCVPLGGELKPEFIAPDGTGLRCAEGYVRSNYWCPDDGICCAPEKQEACGPDKSGYCTDFREGCKKFYEGIGPDTCSRGRSAECCVPAEDEFCGRSTYHECESDNDCAAGGCSGQVCEAEGEGTITTCEARRCYDAERYGLSCGCHNEKCQWAGWEEKCWESDDGYDIYHKGCAEAGDSRLCDHCNDDGSLTEKYCEGDNIHAKTVECPEGYECEDGACSRKCAQEGEYTSGAVAPEYYFDCCEGLESFDPHPPQWVGGGMLCYDPQKGTPVCNGAGTDYEGWYYPDGELLRYENCSNESVECTEGQAKQCGETHIGICEFGTQTCINGVWGECVGAVYPTNETCGDQLDNDCDGQVDEDCICEENWVCSEWDECTPQKYLSRTCEDTNNCGTEINKPETEKSCCYDPDGKDVYVKGETKGNYVNGGYEFITYHDTCYQDVMGDSELDEVIKCLAEECYLMEHWVAESGICESEVFICEIGCVYGRCVTDISEICDDSDGGQVYDTKGTVTTYSSSTFDDYCDQYGLLHEYYCNDSEDWRVITYPCPNGCEEGACLPT